MKSRLFSLCATLLGLASAALMAAEFPKATWQYTTKKPGDGWEKTGFDDSSWKSGQDGFGAGETPGIRVGTKWITSDIWMRRTITFDKVPAEPVLYLFHDEDAEIYLNGALLTQLTGYTTRYHRVPVPPNKRNAIKKGANVLAVHCRQTIGGQGIDVHLLDASKAPEAPPLPKPGERRTPPPPPTEPFATPLITEWGAKVTPENAWQDAYPRPLLVRESWTNLNGLWRYAITPLDAPHPTKWDGDILVPFAVESKLSGVQRLLNPDQALWYQRPLNIQPRAGKRTMLNFEAVDYRCQVWINDTLVGTHTGGSVPFQFDITKALWEDGKNTLTVRVEDATGGSQLRGKQVIRPGGIRYTRVSGIWQTVWLEEIPAGHARQIKTTTKTDGTVTISLTPGHAGTDHPHATVTASLDGKEVARSEGPYNGITLKIPNPKLWSPGSPALYDLAVSFGDDQFTSYVGIREVGQVRDADGHLRFTLNGKPIFHWGPLDQGWWPDGLLTPPSDAGMRYDIEFLKEAGFNMIRKHIKAEPRRYYYHCDQIGMMVWQDHVSGGQSPRWTRMAPDPVDAEWTDDDHKQFMFELDGMITSLESHPSIVVWVPFNEAWGQHRTMEVGEWTVERDPTRLVNIASGGNFWPVGHIADAHAYPNPRFPFDPERYADFIKVVGEFGGHGWPVRGHLWDPARGNWGYGGLPKTIDEYKARYQKTLDELVDLKNRGIAGGVYTQTTDCEVEINGLLSYDRKVQKIPASELRKIHAPLLKK